MTMNYIQEIEAFYKHHNRENEAPFILLSAKMQGIEQGRVLIEDMDKTTIDMLLCWADTREGTFFWVMIHNFNHPNSERWPQSIINGLGFHQYTDRWEAGLI